MVDAFSRGRSESGHHAREQEVNDAQETLRDIAAMCLHVGERIAKKEDVERLLQGFETLRGLARVFALVGVPDAYRIATDEGRRLLEALGVQHLAPSQMLQEHRHDVAYGEAKIWKPIAAVPLANMIQAHHAGYLDIAQLPQYADVLVRGRFALARGANAPEGVHVDPWDWSPEAAVLLARGRVMSGFGFVHQLVYPPEVTREADRIIATRNQSLSKDQSLLERKVAFEEKLFQHVVHIVDRAVHTAALASH